MKKYNHSSDQQKFFVKPNILYSVVLVNCIIA